MALTTSAAPSPSSHHEAQFVKENDRVHNTCIDSQCHTVCFPPSLPPAKYHGANSPDFITSQANLFRLLAYSSLHDAITEDYTILSIFMYFHAACQVLAGLGLWYYLWYLDEDDSRRDLGEEEKKIE